jgi:hypothetical protein
MTARGGPPTASVMTDTEAGQVDRESPGGDARR